MIQIENVPADKLRERLAEFNARHVITVVVTRYVDGWAVAYQIIYNVPQ